jgi:hypothetical protein
VFVDKRVLLKHTGTYVFDATTQDKLYFELDAIAKANTQKITQMVPQGGHEVAADILVPAAEPEVLASSDNSK